MPAPSAQANLKEHSKAKYARVKPSVVSDMLIDTIALLKRKNNIEEIDSITDSLNLITPNCLPPNTKENSFAMKLTPVPRSKKIVFVGDVHGGYYELWNVIRKITDDNLTLNDDIGYFVVLGDMVDRSFFSVETICLICSVLKKNSNRMHILKGNHETFSQWYRDTGVELIGHVMKWSSADEVKKISQSLHCKFFQFTLCLPVVIFTKINNKILQFCHGGIPVNIENNTAFFMSKDQLCFLALQIYLLQQWKSKINSRQSNLPK